MSKYTNECTNMIKKSIELLSITDWTHYSSNEGIDILEKYMDNSPYSYIKMSCSLDLNNCTIMDIVNIIHNPSVNTHSTFISNTILEQVSDEINIACSEFHISQFVSNREFLVLRMFNKLDDGGYILCTQSIKHDTIKMPINPDNIEGTVFRCTIIRPDINIKNKVNLTSIEHVEPNGLIPPMIVNYVKSSANEWIIKMKKMLI